MNTLGKLTITAALGAAGAYLMPGRDDKTPARPMELKNTGRAAVTTHSAMPTWAVVTLGAASGALTTRNRGAAVALAALTAALREVNVTASEKGVRLDSGIPGLGYTIDASRIRSARTVTVTAAEYGGLGLRWSPTRGWGLILNTGPALALEVSDAPLSRFTVTVASDKDAQQAARLLSAVV